MWSLTRLVGHMDDVTVLITLVGGRLASGSKDKTIRLWNVNSSVCEREFDGYVSCAPALVILEDGRIANGAWIIQCDCVT